MTLLVTGFPKFDAHKENATEILIDSMRSSPPDGLRSASHRVVFEVIAFDNDDAATQQRTMLLQFDRTLKAHRPSACLFCGQAASRPWVSIEALAVNVFKGKRIDPAGPPAYWATIPDQQELIDLLRHDGIPAKLSFHAGTHLCNHILYTCLRRAEREGIHMPCGFLHVPMTSRQVIAADEERPSIPLEMTRRALERSIEHILTRLDS